MDLNDLDDLDGDELELEEEIELPQKGAEDISMQDHQSTDDDDNVMDGEDDEAKSSEANRILLESIKKADNVYAVAKLYSSKQFQDAIKKIDSAASQSNSQPDQHSYGAVEHSPEYKLIIIANNYSVEIDNEIIISHKFLKDVYGPRFQELESIIPNPIEYARVVKVIGNQMDISKLDLKTLSNLPSTTVMIVNVSSTTTEGTPLPADQLQKAMEACNLIIELDAIRNRLLNFVQSRMNLIAPNLSAIIGSAVAAKLMSIAGGLTALSKIPACNLQVLGKSGKTNTGLSSVILKKHAGYIYYSELVSSIPSEYRNKATRLISAKCALAIRVDVCRESLDGILGMNMKLEIDKKIEKMLEPPPGKSIKALPVPLEGPKKKRAGKRVSKQKEKYAMTELRKAQNRMTFGVAEEEVGGSMGSTVGMGLIGGQTGKVRASVADKRVKIGLSKKHKAMTEKLNAAATSGFTTSLSFTPVQGIELENPEIQKQKLKEINQKWFSGSFKKE